MNQVLRVQCACAPFRYCRYGDLTEKVPPSFWALLISLEVFSDGPTSQETVYATIVLPDLCAVNLFVCGPVVFASPVVFAMYRPH